MIAYIKGELTQKSPAKAVVEAAGVGYELYIPLSTYDQLSRTGEIVKLHTVHIVREDGQWLYGFATEPEKEMFEKLVLVSGVGPKLAVSVLSGMTVADLSRCVSTGDAKRISSIRGVGKKTAEKICIELKDKVDAFAAFASNSTTAKGKEFMRDAAKALAALGFAEESALKMVSDAIERDPSISDTETLVRKSLSGGK